MAYRNFEKQREAQRRYDDKRAGRTRNFATVVYPESAPSDWLATLADLHVPAFVSPLHDSDLDPDGKVKKPHFHVLLMFENVKNFETQVKPIFDSIGGVGRELVQSARGYARYLCHLDNPEKHQYEPMDVKCFGGVDFFDIIGLPGDRYKAIGEMMDWVQATGCMSFAELSNFAKSSRQDWFRMLCDNSSFFMDKYIKSLGWQQRYFCERENFPQAGAADPDPEAVQDSSLDERQGSSLDNDQRCNQDNQSSSAE